MESPHSDVVYLDPTQKSPAAATTTASVVVFKVPAGAEADALNLAEEWRRQQPATMRVVLLENLNSANLLSFVNRGRAFRVLGADAPAGDVASAVDQALARHAVEFERRQLLNGAKDQNRQLEQMVSSLEKLVKERTRSAAESKSEVERRVSHLRDLLVFIKELSTAQSLEDLLVFIRREFKHFHRLGDPCLAYSLSSGSLRLAYFRGGRVFERRANRPWPDSLRIRINHVGDSQYLANEFGRPVNKVLAIPLPVRKANGSSANAPALLFEHAMSAAESDEFLAAISERMQSVSIALDRLMLEFDLRTASYLWEHTFDGIEEPVAILDMEYNLLRCNRHFSADLIMKKCYQNFSQAEEPCAGCPVHETISGGEGRQGVVRRGNEAFEVHSYPIVVSAEHRATSVVNHYVNITHQLELQEKAVQTEKMAALGHLAGHIAHELNNPLTGIRSLAQVLLAQKVGSTQVQGDLAEVEKAAQRSQTIIGNLLEFAAGGSEGKVQACDLNEIVKRTLPLLKTAMGAHNSQIELADGPALVEVEPQLLQQVIFNLIKNACQAMTKRGDLTVSTEATSWKGQAAWCLSVIDSGSGIPEEIRSNIFSPFFTTKREGEGTGLGLSLSLNIVKRFGGDIEVESVVGEGTKFSVFLPRAKGTQ